MFKLGGPGYNCLYAAQNFLCLTSSQHKTEKVVVNTIEIDSATKKFKQEPKVCP